MDYKLFFFILLAYVVGYLSANFRLYIGTDRDKYKSATFGILLKRK